VRDDGRSNIMMVVDDALKAIRIPVGLKGDVAVSAW
jgi:hypothetical protein